MRILSASGPTGGEVRLSDGRAPEKVAIIHCAGSLDPKHKDYCSGVCCSAAFKFNAILAHKVPGVKVDHYTRTLSLAGKEEYELFRRAEANPHTRMIPYRALDDLSVKPAGSGRKAIWLDGQCQEYDLVVLMPAVIPPRSAAEIAALLDLGLDRQGFFEEMHGRVDATRSKVRGVYLAGSCQSPTDMAKATTQGASAAGLIMAALVPGRKLDLEAIHAAVDADRCSACKSCMGVCPYKAISFNEEKEAAEVNPVLCLGCGTCVAACPSGAIQGRHFTTEQIFAEIEGALV
jgi:heterodisulfide reductase subunit A